MVALVKEGVARSTHIHRALLLSCTACPLVLLNWGDVLIIRQFVWALITTGSAEGLLAGTTHELLASDLLLLHLIPLNIFFMFLRLTETHDLADEVLNASAFDPLRRQVLTVVTVNFVCRCDYFLQECLLKGATS